MQGSIHMSRRTRQEYFAILRNRYQDLESKKQRSLLISEAVSNTGLNRKSVIRALGKPIAPDSETPKLGRPRAYSEKCIELLKRLYRASDYVCSDRLREMIPVLIAQWRAPIDVDVLNDLLRISPASMDRYLKKYRGLERRRRNCGTRPGSLRLKNMIPLKALGNIAKAPGQLQTDTVAHGGMSMSGEFIWSLTCTDEYSGWTLNKSFFGKSAKNTLPAIQQVHLALPFDLHAFNVDNGSEFINYRIYEYFEYLAQNKVIPFPMSRSRAYKKNDNCHVEQKNWTSVRQLFGYDRFEHKELVPVMNEIYRIQNLISNFFLPQYKLKSKVRIGAKIKKKYETPKTPYQRLLESTDVTDAQKQKLTETYLSLNYFDLVAQREALLAHFEILKKELNSKKNNDSSIVQLHTASR
jgi:hypothetical protein